MLNLKMSTNSMYIENIQQADEELRLARNAARKSLYDLHQLYELRRLAKLNYSIEGFEILNGRRYDISNEGFGAAIVAAWKHVVLFIKRLFIKLRAVFNKVFGKKLTNAIDIHIIHPAKLEEVSHKFITVARVLENDDDFTSKSEEVKKDLINALNGLSREHMHIDNQGELDALHRRYTNIVNDPDWNQFLRQKPAEGLNEKATAFINGIYTAATKIAKMMSEDMTALMRALDPNAKEYDPNDNNKNTNTNEPGKNNTNGEGQTAQQQAAAGIATTMYEKLHRQLYTELKQYYIAKIGANLITGAERDEEKQEREESGDTKKEETPKTNETPAQPAPAAAEQPANTADSTNVTGGTGSTQSFKVDVYGGHTYVDMFNIFSNIKILSQYAENIQPSEEKAYEYIADTQSGDTPRRITEDKLNGIYDKYKINSKKVKQMSLPTWQSVFNKIIQQEHGNMKVSAAMQKYFSSSKAQLLHTFLINNHLIANNVPKNAGINDLMRMFTKTLTDKVVSEVYREYNVDMNDTEKRRVGTASTYPVILETYVKNLYNYYVYTIYKDMSDEPGQGTDAKSERVTYMKKVQTLLNDNKITDQSYPAPKLADALQPVIDSLADRNRENNTSEVNKDTIFKLAFQRGILQNDKFICNRWYDTIKSRKTDENIQDKTVEVNSKPVNMRRFLLTSLTNYDTQFKHVTGVNDINQADTALRDIVKSYAYITIYTDKDTSKNISSEVAELMEKYKFEMLKYELLKRYEQQLNSILSISSNIKDIGPSRLVDFLRSRLPKDNEGNSTEDSKKVLIVGRLFAPDNSQEVSKALISALTPGQRHTIDKGKPTETKKTDRVAYTESKKIVARRDENGKDITTSITVIKVPQLPSVPNNIDCRNWVYATHRDKRYKSINLTGTDVKSQAEQLVEKIVDMQINAAYAHATKDITNVVPADTITSAQINVLCDFVKDTVDFYLHKRYTALKDEATEDDRKGKPAGEVVGKNELTQQYSQWLANLTIDKLPELPGNLGNNDKTRKQVLKEYLKKLDQLDPNKYYKVEVDIKLKADKYREQFINAIGRAADEKAKKLIEDHKQTTVNEKANKTKNEANEQKRQLVLYDLRDTKFTTLMQEEGNTTWVNGVSTSYLRDGYKPDKNAPADKDKKHKYIGTYQWIRMWQTADSQQKIKHLVDETPMKFDDLVRAIRNSITVKKGNDNSPATIEIVTKSVKEHIDSFISKYQELGKDVLMLGKPDKDGSLSNSFDNISKRANSVSDPDELKELLIDLAKLLYAKPSDLHSRMRLAIPFISEADRNNAESNQTAGNTPQSGNQSRDVNISVNGKVNY